MKPHILLTFLVTFLTGRYPLYPYSLVPYLEEEEEEDMMHNEHTSPIYECTVVSLLYLS